MLRGEMSPASRTWPLVRPDLEAYEIVGTRPEACLLLHGFTASPAEMRPLALALAAAGFSVIAVRLPGHGTDVADLERTAASEWIDAAEEALERVSGAGPVFVAGQSMGGLLSLILAARHPEKVRAVASLAAPMWFLERKVRILVPFFRFSSFWRLKRYVSKGPSDLPPDRLATHFTYDRFPTRGILALGDVIREARQQLPSLRVPLLVLHGKRDRSAPFAGARVLLDEAGRDVPGGLATKEYVEMEHSHHLLTLDVESEAVCARVVDFFSRIAGTAGAAANGR
jgi:carboxylesterase